MRTFSIYTLGCKVNHYESAQIRQFLEENGLKSAKKGQIPDFFVINTCCVTATASAKSRQYIQRTIKSNPTAKKIICGCLAAAQSGELFIPTDSNTHLINNRAQLASTIRQITGNISLNAPNQLPLLTNFKEQTRAFLKVQDGCDGTCSYCIIPKVRPDVQSKPIENVIFEAKNLVAAGHREIVVTGVNLGAYGQASVRRTDDGEQKTEQRTPNKTAFSILIEALAKVEGLQRLRVSSLEPGDITAELLDVFCENKNIMPHIHLSVQSGSDKILRRMCRPYSAGQLREKIAMIKSRLNRPAITCDIIVGFPGETDEDFEQTCELARWAGFSKIHVFPFSAREETAASKMKNKVDSKTIKKRAEILRKLGDELGFKFREQFIGETCEVLVEDAKAMSGHCERYFMVSLATKTRRHEETQRKSSDNLVSWRLGGKGDIVRLKISGVTDKGSAGEAKS